MILVYSKIGFRKEINQMVEINLRRFYPFYAEDRLVAISEEIATQLEQWEREERTYQRNIRRYHDSRALNRVDVADDHALFEFDNPDALREQKRLEERLRTAIQSLPEKQARRICRRYCEGMSLSAIAKAEQISCNTASISVCKAMTALKKFLENDEKGGEKR